MKLDRALIDQAAAQHSVSPDVLAALLELSAEFPDMAAWGAKARLLRRVTEIIEAAVEAQNS
ncbi:DNA modification system-associated small protein [Mesorhizobium sp. J8]|uniref:DNA modification system-associated small protein n=1 Tax=Mesorhizobium sp. J8 TaxID=2777475 RepID=UPI00191543C6|nr:DNA modification system-associated small protein [Mesorhizobium sp. J8]